MGYKLKATNPFPVFRDIREYMESRVKAAKNYLINTVVRIINSR